MADHLLDKLVNLELLLLVGVLSQVGGSLGVLHVQTLCDDRVFLFLGQLNLVCLVLVRIHKVLSSYLRFILFFFLDNLCLLLLLSNFLKRVRCGGEGFTFPVLVAGAFLDILALK